MAEQADRFDGPNWRDDPLENTPIVRRSQGFLKGRGHQSPDLFRLKLMLVEKIRETVESKGWKQAEIAEHVNQFDKADYVDQPDVSRILNGNVDRFSVDKLMVILAALDNKVSLRSEPVAEGRGCIVMA